MKIRFHHKGYFISDPIIAYKKGEVYEFGGELDIDQTNLKDFDKLVREVGVEGGYKLFYVSPGWELSDGLRPLKTDRDVIKFINDHINHGAADFYVEGDKDLEGHYSRYVSDEEEVVVLDKGKEPAGVEEEEESNPEYVGDDGDEHEFEAETGSVDGGSIDDSDFDEEWEWTSVLPNQTLNPTPVAQSSNSCQAIVGVEASRNTEATTEVDFEDENGDSNFLESCESSEEDGAARKKKKYNRFKFPGNDETVIFEEGQIFATALLIKNVVKEYALQNRKNIHLKKSEKKRIIVKCSDGCPYHMRFSRVPPQTFYVLSSYNSAHKCTNTGRVRLLTIKLLAKKLVPTLRHTPDMTIKALQDLCKRNWFVILSRFQMYRAKLKALEMIHGASEEQYAHLRNYAEELLRSNPGSSVKIKCKETAGGFSFQRIYVCFDACKRAFVQSCRPLIGLDGCFLKGRYGGQLLSAIGKDGNNQMIPIAFAIVEAETK